MTKLLTKTRDYASRAVNVANLSRIFGRFGAPFLCPTPPPPRSRGNGACVKPQEGR